MVRPFSRSLMLVGPTTTGKTEIAIALARLLDGELINADKFYLYKGFPSVTGLPDFADYPDIRTHLYEILHPIDNCLGDQEYVEHVKTIQEELWSRRKLPIIEGCYHRFAKSLMNTAGSTRFTLVGIKWTTTEGLQTAVECRVDSILNGSGIEEVQNGLRSGWRNTYAMRKGSIIRPLVEYCDGKITLSQARDKAVADILYAAYKAYRRLLDLQAITWCTNGEDAVNTISSLFAKDDSVDLR